MRLRGVAGAASVCCVCLLLLLTTKHDSEEGENPVVLVPRGGREIGSSGRASSAYDGLIKRLENEADLGSIRQRMLSVASRLENNRLAIESDDSIDGEEEKNEDLPPAVKDMASQAERVNAKARIAEEQVDAANKIMMLRKKVKEAAEDRVKIERRRDRRAEAEALRLESKLSDMAREIEDLTRESRAKSVESEMRASAASKLLAAASGHEYIQFKQENSTSLRPTGVLGKEAKASHRDEARHASIMAQHRMHGGIGGRGRAR